MSETIALDSCPFEPRETEALRLAWFEVDKARQRAERRERKANRERDRVAGLCDAMNRLAHQARAILAAERPGLSPRLWSYSELRELAGALAGSGYREESDLVVAYAKARLKVAGALSGSRR